MGIAYQLLFWIHMISLAAGGVAAYGIPIVGMRMATATAETRPLLFSLAERFSNVGRVALALLIITGPTMFWLGWNWTAPNMAAFITKMVLVVLLLIVVIIAGINAKRAQGGDMTAAKRAPMLGMTAALIFTLIPLAAALAFK
ncbi:MAG TPA: hypothetical protein VHA07_10060 [Devosia sp.]|nr:hypothetical protein [Devosia sp.]